MFSRFATIAGMCLALASSYAISYPQAVVPNPTDISPVINPPNPQTNIVISVADFMVGGAASYQAFKNALAASQWRHAAKLLIPPGRYVFDDPEIVQTGVHVGLAGQSDLTIDGQGAELSHTA